MRPGPILATLLFALAIGGPATGCAGRNGEQTTHIEVPGEFGDATQFLAGLNHLALMPEDSPERSALREQLIGFVAPYIEQQFAHGDLDEGMAALHHAIGMYTPAELLADKARAPQLAAAAHTLYLIAAKTGREDPAVLGLSIEYQFGDAATRKRIDDEWADLGRWVEGGNVYARDLAHVGGIERKLEESVAIFPSKWTVAQLEEIYLSRMRAALAARSRGESLDDAQSHRIKYSPYLLARLHLRTDNLQAAADALEDTPDPYMTQLRDKILAALRPGRSSQALNDLVAEMKPAEDERGALPDSVQTQAWAIVDNLAKRILAQHPEDALGHYYRAEALRRTGLLQAAMVHYERVLSQKQDMFEVWAHLAGLYHDHLGRLAASDPDAALAHLAKVEALHTNAVEQWPDRPIRPNLADAFALAAEGLYDVGRGDEATELLERANAIEPSPEALDLLGTIALKRGRYDDAWTHYEQLLLLPFADQRARLSYESRSQTRLGEIAIRSGRPGAGARQLRAALEPLNAVLAWPNLDPQERTQNLVDRCRVLFLLGETELAMEDFRGASALAPDVGVVYAEPMLLASGHGYYPQALEVYERAITQRGIDESLRLYFSMWILDLAKRQGQKAPASATRYVAEFDGEAWHQALGAHAQGKIDYAQLLAKATDAGERAEAHFYEGLRVWRSGQQDEALALMRKVLESGMMSFFEYEMAQNYLDWSDMPRTARSPLLEATAPSK